MSKISQEELDKLEKALSDHLSGFALAVRHLQGILAALNALTKAKKQTAK